MPKLPGMAEKHRIANERRLVMEVTSIAGNHEALTSAKYVDADLSPAIRRDSIYERATRFPIEAYSCGNSVTRYCTCLRCDPWFWKEWRGEVTP